MTFILKGERLVHSWQKLFPNCGCLARQEEVEARDQGQLDDLLQLHRQSHEKERDEGTKPRVLNCYCRGKKPKGFILSTHKYSQYCTSYSTVHCSGNILQKN